MQYLDREISRLSRLDILDVGCGDGQFTVRLAGRENRVTAIDPNPSPQLMNHPEIKFVSARGESLPFTAESFDMVFCSDVFEHLPAYGPVLAEIGRVLRPGGKAIISTVEGGLRSPLPFVKAARRAPAGFARLLNICQYGDGELDGHLGHINLSITMANLLQDAEALGLRPVKTVRYCWGFGRLLMELFYLGGERWKRSVFPLFRLVLPLDKVLRFGKAWQFCVVVVKSAEGNTSSLL
jgi:SAM-dependent methyltransferase